MEETFHLRIHYLLMELQYLNSKKEDTEKELFMYG